MKQVGCNEVDKSMNEMEEFDYTVEQFADLQLLRYKVYGFEELSLKQKKLIYYLSQAALQGRDILFDQNGKYNLLIRKMLETVYTEYQGDRTDVNFVNLETYLKRIWFSNGIHHHYASDKFVPGFTPEFFRDALNSVDAYMYLHLGAETVVRTDSIVAVCDLDNASSSHITREALRAAEKAGKVVNVADDLPKSFVVCREDGKTRIYLSQLNTATLLKRAENISFD